MCNEASGLRSGGGQKSCQGCLPSSVCRLELQEEGRWLQRALPPPLLLSQLPLPPLPAPDLGRNLGSREGGDHGAAPSPISPVVYRVNGGVRVSLSTAGVGGVRVGFWESSFGIKASDMDLEVSGGSGVTSLQPASAAVSCLWRAALFSFSRTFPCLSQDYQNP